MVARAGTNAVRTRPSRGSHRPRARTAGHRHFGVDVQHHRKADDFGAAVEALERVGMDHVPTLRGRPARLKRVPSDNTREQDLTAKFRSSEVPLENLSGQSCEPNRADGAHCRQGKAFNRSPRDRHSLHWKQDAEEDGTHQSRKEIPKNSSSTSRQRRENQSRSERDNGRHCDRA